MRQIINTAIITVIMLTGFVLVRTGSSITTLTVVDNHFVKLHPALVPRCKKLGAGVVIYAQSVKARTVSFTEFVEGIWSLAGLTAAQNPLNIPPTARPPC